MSTADKLVETIEAELNDWALKFEVHGMAKCIARALTEAGLVAETPRSDDEPLAVRLARQDIERGNSITDATFTPAAVIEAYEGGLRLAGRPAETPKAWTEDETGQAAADAYNAVMPFEWETLEDKTKAVFIAFLQHALANPKGEA